MVARVLLLALATALALGAAFLLLLEASNLEAEYINLGTVLGRDDPDPQLDLLWSGIVLAVLAGALILIVLARDRRRS
jgi:hypothetical protein